MESDGGPGSSRAAVPGSLEYNRRIDGLRAVAVLLVVIWHWLPQRGGINWTPNGELGVDLFFVVSGYLITSILLKFRERVEGGAATAGRALFDFYVRRGLRLFPLYFAVLGVVYLAPDVTGTSIRRAWPWYAGFVQNVWMLRLGSWDGFLAPFWSLAVEEQFYLVWGVTVLFAPRATLAPIVAVGAACGIAFRAAGLALAPAGELGGALWNAQTPACLDALGAGCLLALAGTGTPLRIGMERWIRLAALPALALVSTYRLAPSVWQVVGRSTVAVLGLAALFWALSDTSRRGASSWERLLEARAVVEFGRRSYGLYVFHNLIPYLCFSLVGVLAKRGVALPSLPAGWTGVLLERSIWFALLVGLAFASWRHFESPINRLKSRFAP